MESILDQSRGKRVVLYGPTAALHPAGLFARGVTEVATRVVNNSQLMADILISSAGSAERFFPEASTSLTVRPGPVPRTSGCRRS